MRKIGGRVIGWIVVAAVAGAIPGCDRNDTRSPSEPTTPSAPTPPPPAPQTPPKALHATPVDRT